jgi:hypothetical protein
MGGKPTKVVINICGEREYEAIAIKRKKGYEKGLELTYRSVINLNLPPYPIKIICIR